MCPYCHLYTAIGKPCEICAVSALTVDKPLASKKRKQGAKSRRDNAVSWLAQLHAAGLPDDNAIAEGLRTGAVVQAIGWQANYLHAIDYLISRGYEVTGYRARVVAGSNRL